MNLRRLKIAAPACCFALLSMVSLRAQNPPQDPAQAAPQAAAPAPVPPPAKSTEPDYPDPRTFTFGISYWITIPGNGPAVREGQSGLAFGTLKNLGADHKTPAIELSMPITRTGVLHFEAFRSQGDGTQTAPQTTYPFGATFNKGDFVSTSYSVTGGKLYLDDLLHPFKFPVARFRLKSLLGVEYLAVKTTLDAPLAPATDTSGNAVTTTATASRNLIFPSLGLAVEYDLARHLTFRAAASGFGLPGRALLADGESTISWRRKKLEVVGGFKALHFRTSVKKDEYASDTLDGGFVALRWHFE